ncbi:MAG: bifunctional DNA-formamidopyrimidine glycosylase/DNA-(apurinic or apyrimidinic site) lyase [Magnetococcus sp. DMHC-6]
MPELPEVETILQGLRPQLVGVKIISVVIRRLNLRWPLPVEALRQLEGRSVCALMRRGKYLLLQSEMGWIIFHLGMSGRLTLRSQTTPAQKHDHLDFLFANGLCLRLTDPRRFGAVLWSCTPLEHPLLVSLGPEPLTPQFDGGFFFQRCRGRRVPVKNLLMDSHVVAGVGNIYATEALFKAGILPIRPAGTLTQMECDSLVSATQATLVEAIQQGGTTLRDFRNGDGAPGYFQQKLLVYGREGQTCRHCPELIQQIRLGGRSSCYCPGCQI